MWRMRRVPLALSGAAAGALCGALHHSTHCHAHHGADRLAAVERRVEQLESEAAARYGVQQFSGQADMVFSWDEGLTAALPAKARAYERDMHGGFSEDQRTHKVYTGIPGCGLFEISADLTTWTQIGSDPRLEANIHGLVSFEHKGRTLLALAQNDAQRVLIVGLNGEVVQELGRPRGGEFAHDEANAYYSARRHAGTSAAEKVFCCTDVAFLDGKLYVVTGYSQGDFVLTAQPAGPESHAPWVWGGGEGVAWGGKGETAGRFQTAHGIFAHGGHLYVANRERYEVLKFTPKGRLVEAMPDIPFGARICNVGRADRHEYFVMNALAPLPHTAPRTAPIFVHSGESLVSTIDPGSLGIPVLKHIHHVHPHYTPDGTLYLLVHGWRDGKFAVLRHADGRSV